MIDTLIVDDEAVARQGLRLLLEGEEGFRVVGECADGARAAEAIRELDPDLVLLDIRMPEMDGFQVLDALDPDRIPAVVFVTAHGDRALEAFRVDAVDYLLKPFDHEELRRTLRRVRRRIRSGEVEELSRGARALLELLGKADQPPAPGREPAYPDRIAVKRRDRIRFVPTREIRWIDVADNYVRLHLEDGFHLHRSSLSAMEELLDPATFLRISQSYIVNLEWVEEAVRLPEGRWELVLSGGTRVRSSRRYRDRVEPALDPERGSA